MFDALSQRFETITGRMRGIGVLREAEIDEAMREIRLALLEADVNLDVTKLFCDRVKERCLNESVASALSPGQHVVKIVNEELIAILGGEQFSFSYASQPPTVVLMAGLQGAGKTTATAKLAKWFKSQGRNPLLVGADLQRPAAVEQLRVLAGQVGVSVFSEPTDPVSVAKNAIEEAKNLGRDVVIIDTAGRTTIDEEMMQQVRDISAATNPHFTFLVIDAMIGQEAVATARAFNESLALDAVILSKLDGDARGGAALSVKGVVGKPIAFASVGEKLADFEPFYPDRMASRILGMGDVATLIEKAEETFDAGEAERQVGKLLSGKYDLEDFLAQMQQIKKMGPLQGLLGMMPGVPKEIKNAQIDDGELARVEAIIRSMTPKERRDPNLINAPRRGRIAAGSGTSSSEVSQLLKQFKDAQKMMSGMGGMLGGGNRKQTKKNKKGKKGKKGGPSAPAGLPADLSELFPGLAGGDFPGLSGGDFPGRSPNA